MSKNILKLSMRIILLSGTTIFASGEDVFASFSDDDDLTIPGAPVLASDYDEVVTPVPSDLDEDDLVVTGAAAPTKRASWEGDLKASTFVGKLTLLFDEIHVISLLYDFFKSNPVEEVANLIKKYNIDLLKHDLNDCDRGSDYQSVWSSDGRKIEEFLEEAKPYKNYLENALRHAFQNDYSKWERLIGHYYRW